MLLKGRHKSHEMALVLWLWGIALVMTLHHFNALDQEKQRRWVLENGVYLCSRSSQDFIVLLFGLDGFYIEVFFYTATNRVFLIKSFDQTEALLPYLDRIDIQPLLNA